MIDLIADVELTIPFLDPYVLFEYFAGLISTYSFEIKPRVDSSVVIEWIIGIEIDHLFVSNVDVGKSKAMFFIVLVFILNINR